jgi:hypothetical protein
MRALADSAFEDFGAAEQQEMNDADQIGLV